MDIFLKGVTYLPEEPDTGSSRDVPEEDIVIIEDDNSTPVMASEDGPVGQDMEVEDSGNNEPDPLQAFVNVSL